MLRRLLPFVSIWFACSLPSLAEEPNAPAVGELRSFGDWVIGCDNLRRCTALGFTDAGSGGAMAYLRISRDAGADEAPRVSVASWLDGEETGKTQDLTFALSDAAAALPIDRLAASDEGGYAMAEVPTGRAMAFVSALLPRQGLAVRAGPSGEPATISLRGMSAALRAMDDEQARVDTASALVARGSLPSSHVPAPPEPPAPVAAVTLRELDPVPPLPEGIPPGNGDCTGDPGPVAFEAANGTRIFGTCAFNGAYNVGMRYWAVQGDAVRALAFPPGAQTTDDADTLVNAALDDNGLTLSAFEKGRGIGDCGTLSSWSFDGTAFQLVSFSGMTDCRGVPVSDWPLLFTRDVRRAKP